MDVMTLVALHDQNARNEVDARLHFIQRAGGELAGSTRNIVYATDPLKNISYPFECIMTVPTDPPSRKVQLIGGFFFANGKLYSFPGMETPEIEIDLNQDTYVLTGVRIDPRTDRTDLYVQTTYGEYPFMDRDMVPSALIKIPRGFTEIISGYIMDIRPFLHYNVSTPEDRAVIDISCINPKESVSFELMRNRRMPPIMNFYKKLPPEGTHTITHTFKSEDDVVLLGDDPVDVDELNGVTLKKQLTAKVITMPNADNVLFVSALKGNRFGDGSASAPLLTLGDAINRYNGMDQYDTIFLQEGIYVLNQTENIHRSVKIIGESPTTVIIRLQNNDVPLITVTDSTVLVEFRTVQIISTSPRSGALAPASIVTDGYIYFYNCILKQGISVQILPLVQHSGQLYIVNCVVHNPYSISTSISPLYETILSGFVYFYNNYIIGVWNHVFSLGVDQRNYQDTGDGSYFQFEDLNSYYPTVTTPNGVHGGLTVNSVATDLDGAPISTGIYGGPYAAMFRTYSYPINQMPIFKYAYHTLFSPVIARFVEVVPLTSFSSSSACQIFGAVSFNGGHDWVVWDEYLGAWKRIADLQTLDVNGNLADDLATRLVNMGPITTKGEICFAWALKTNNPNMSPHIRGVQMKVKADADTITPIQPENLDVWIAGDTVMITNLSDEKQNDVVVVAY